MTQPYPYPAQQPQAYQPPAQPQYPNYPPPQAPQYPQYPAQQPYPQQYAPPPQAPAQPLAAGNLDDFYNQPSAGGGAALKFEQIGTRYVGIVTRPIGNGDIQQQTDVHQRPQFFKDGRPKFVMKVPLQMQPSQLYPDGLAQWYVKGAARDELVRAMAEAGAPEGAPEQGAIIDVTFTSQRPSGAGMNPAKLFQVRYTRPQGSQAAPAPAAPPVATSPAPGQVTSPPAPPVQPAPPANYPPAPAQQQQYAPAPDPQQYQQPAAPAPQQQYAPAPQQQVAQPPQAAPVPPAQPNGPTPQPPSDLSPEQQALLAQLTGAQAPAQNG